MQQIVNVTIDSKGNAIPDSKSIGLQYETGVTRYAITPDPSWVSDQYFYYMIVSPPEDSDNKQYAVPLVNQGGTFIFEISSGITWHVGNYKFAFLTMSKEMTDGIVPDNGIVGISESWNGKITKSILDYISLQKQPVDANFQLLYTDLMALSVEVRNKANYAQEQGDYAKKTADDILSAKEAGEFDGEDGISPIIETEENINGFKVGITDVKGKKELQLNHGISPDIVTSEDEEGFNVEITDHKGKEEFKLNHGKSPEINVEEIAGGHKVIIKDINGTKEILVMDGEDAVSPVITTSKEGRVTTITITDAEGVKTIPISDGKDAVSPIVSMTKEDGVITIRVEDADGVKEESVQEGITKHNVPEFIGTLENPVDFSDLCEGIEDKDEYTGFCIIGGYFKVTDRKHNDLGVKHWTEIFPGTSSITLNAAESLLVQYEYAKYTGDEYGEIRFGAVISDDLYVLRGVPSLGLIAGWRGGRIATSVDLYNDYYKKTETYSKGETDTKIAEAVAELGKLDIEVVDSLPANAETNKIYLVAQDRVNPDVYDEYLYINNEWERIGTTAMSIGTQILNLVGTEDNPVDFQELFNAVEKGGSFYLSGYVKCDDNGTSVVKHLSELLTYGTWYDAKYLCNYLIFDQDPKFGYISLVEAMGSNKPRYYRFAIYEESNNQFNSHRQGISLEESSIVAYELVRDKDLYAYVDSTLGDIENLLKEV